MKTNYFFGSNTASGFKAAHDDVLNTNKLVILKGGAGTGKSTIMKKVATKAEQAGYDVELFHCSSDADSLDAVYIPMLNAAIADGTSPHVIEARMPALKHFVINLSDMTDTHKLSPFSDTIENCVNYKKRYFDNAYCQLNCANLLNNYIDNIVLSYAEVEKIENTAAEIFNTVRHAKGAQAGTRFVSAVTDKGVVSYLYENITDSKNISVTVEYPCVSTLLFASLSKRLTAAEIPFTVYLSPISGLPAEALKIGNYVVARSELLLRADYNYGLISVTKQVNCRLFDGVPELIDKHVNLAIDNIRYAHLTHMEMEKIYYPAMDWADVNEKTARITDIMFN